MSLGHEPLFRRFCLFADPMVSIHDLEGTIRSVNLTTLEQLSIAVSDIVGARWQQFVPDCDHPAEERLVRTVLQSGKAAYSRVQAYIAASGLSLTAVQRVSLVQADPAATPLIMREAFLLNGLEDAFQPVSSADDDALSYIASQLTFLRGVALADDEGLLAYLLEMAMAEAHQQIDQRPR